MLTPVHFGLGFSPVPVVKLGCAVLLSEDTRRQAPPRGVATAVRIVRQTGGPFQVARKLGAQVLVCWVGASGDCGAVGLPIRGRVSDAP